MRRLGLITAVTLALALAVPPVASSQRGPQVKQFKLSFYGVQTQAYKEVWTPEPCKVGGRGGGLDGTLTQNSTIRWETTKPARANFTFFPGGGGFLSPTGPRGATLPAKARIESKVTNSVVEVKCAQDGTELRSFSDPRKIGTKCPTTSTDGYFVGWFFVNNGKMDTVASPEDGVRAMLNDGYTDCNGNRANFGINRVKDPIPDRIIANLGKSGKILSKRTETKSYPGEPSSLLDYSNKIRTTTYSTLKRIK